MAQVSDFHHSYIARDPDKGQSEMMRGMSIQATDKNRL